MQTKTKMVHAMAPGKGATIWNGAGVVHMQPGECRILPMAMKEAAAEANCFVKEVEVTLNNGRLSPEELAAFDEKGKRIGSASKPAKNRAIKE